MINETWIKWSENVHNTLYEQLSKTREEMKTKPPEELADIGFVCKKIYEQLDSIRKETQRLQELAEKLACLKAVQEEKVKIHGRLATGTPDVSMSANLPHPRKNPEEYLALCDYLGIPKQMIDWDLFRFHWPGFKKFFTHQMQNGKPVPPGVKLGKTYSHYKLKYRAKK